MITVSDNGADAPGAPYTAFRILKEAHEQLRNRVRDGEEPLSLLIEVEEFVNRGSKAGAYLDSLDDRMAAQGMLDYWVPMLFRAKRTAPDTTLAEFDPTTSPLLDDVKDCPYLGLNSFQEENSHLFHGRERLVEMLVKKTRSSRLVFVLGPSGSGKSSLVLAGLIPTLKKESAEAGADYRFFPRHVPGSNPLRNLSEALRSFYNESAEWAAGQSRMMREDHGYLARLIAEKGNGRAVCVVDQFEEAFTLCLDDALREAYIGNLTALASAQEANHLVILTMRSDYETYVVQVPTLVAFFGDENLFRVTPLMADDLRRAIEEPARDVGLKFDDGIVDALVKDILGEPAGLPLLQFTLLRLWKTREGGRSRITWDSYRKLGNARRALSLTADEFFNALPIQNQAIVKRILMRMVRPSGIAETVSNRVRRASLNVGDPELVKGALKALHEAGLVRITPGPTPENDQIEVAHEALVRNWSLLVDWVEKERVFMRQRLRLTAAADQWFEHAKDPGSLLSGKLLAEAQQYDTTELNDLEREFVQASADAEKAAEDDKAEAAERERQLEREKLLALEQKAVEEAKNMRRLRFFVPILASLLLLSLVAVVAAMSSRSEAQMNLTKAEKSAEVAKEQEKRAITLAQVADDAREKAEAEKKNTSDALMKAEAERKRADDERIRANEKAHQLELAQARLISLTAEVKRLASLDHERAELAERHREAASLVAREPAKAGPLLTDLLTSYRANPKDFDPDGSKVANVLREQVRVYRNIIEKKRQSSDEANVETFVKIEKQKYEEALKPIESRVKAIEDKVGPDDMALISVLQERADFFEYVDETELALKDKSRALGILEKHLTSRPSNDPELYLVQYRYDDLAEQLAAIYRKDDDQEDLEKLYLHALEVKLKSEPQPDKSGAVYKARITLGKIYLLSNEPAKAEEQYRAAITIVQNQFGADVKNHYITDSMQNLALALERQAPTDVAKRDEAIVVYTKLLELLPKDDVAKAKERASLLLRLGGIYNRAGKESEAEATYLEAANIFESAEVKDPNDIAQALNPLGRLYFKQGRYDKAEAVYKKLVALTAEKEKSDPLSSTEHRRMLVSLAETYFKWNKLKESEEIYLGIVEKIQNSAKPSTSDLLALATSQLVLADIYRTQKDYPKAEAGAKEAITVVQRFGVSSYIIRGHSALGLIYEEQNKFTEAEEQYKLALEKASSTGTNRPLRIDVLESYARLLTKQNRVDEATKLRAEATNLREPTKHQ
jgi:tetratricopeptide (TPR) repeat protein